MSLIDKLLDPKVMIFDAVKQRLEGTGVVKIILYFNVVTDKYSVMLQKKDLSSMKLDIDKDEITMIKKVLTNKIKRKYEKDTKQKAKAVIVQMDMESDDLQIFVEDEKSVVTKFNL